MATALNTQPAGFLPLALREQIQTQLGDKTSDGKKPLPRFFKRLWGAIKQTVRPTDNPNFIMLYHAAYGPKKLDDRVARGIDAIIPYLALNHNFVTGIVDSVMCERDLGVHSGLCTYKGRIVISAAEMQHKKQHGQPTDRYVTYADISEQQVNNIGHGRISNALTVLKKLNMVTYLDKALRGPGQKFIGRHLWLTERFYNAFGVTLGEDEKEQRQYLLKRPSFAAKFKVGQQRVIHTVKQAIDAALEWSRAKRYSLYKKQLTEHRDYVQRKRRAESMGDEMQLRSELTREVTLEMSQKAGFLGFDRGLLLQEVERRFQRIMSADKTVTLKRTLKPPR